MGSGTGSSKVDTVAARLSLDPLTVAEGITESSFPNQGITCRFLERIAADPRMEAPVHTLPIVGPNMQLMPALSLAKLGDLATGPLLEIARAYRVFSEMDGGEEFGRYDGRIQVSNEEVLAALKRPPTTTTQVNICIVKPDSLEARCSYARMVIECLDGFCPLSSCSHHTRDDLRSTALPITRGPVQPKWTSHMWILTIVDLSIPLPRFVRGTQLMARGEDVGLVGRPTVFLSHAWRYAFRDVVQAVVERFGAVNNGVFIWNDIFVEDQNSSDGKPEDYFYTAFKSAITTIGHTVVVFQPWADPLPMTRAWCIFEMYSAMTSGVRLDVVLPETEKASLRAAVLADPSAVNKVLVDVDANKAECFKEEDRVQIFAAIDMMPGGMHRLNAEMKGMLRKWAVSTVHDFCGSEADADATATATATTAQDREALAELGLLYHNVGSILREDGDFTGALALMKRSVAAREAALGPDHADVGKSHCGVAFALRSQRNWAEAKPMFEEALAIQIKALGEDHADVAHSYHGLGLVLDLGETLEPSHPEYMQEALRAYRKSLAIRVKVLGARHQRVSTSYNNIAAVLKMQGKTAESYAMYEKALSIKLEVWGPNHPSVGTTLCVTFDLDSHCGPPQAAPVSPRNVDVLFLIPHHFRVCTDW